jgi:site-specific DNA recombinase
MRELGARKCDLDRLLGETDEPPPVLHPSLAEISRSRIATLAEALGREDTRGKAAEVVRSLVSAIVLVPEAGELTSTLRGELAGMLSMAADKKRSGKTPWKGGRAS